MIKKKTLDKQINWWITIGISLPMVCLSFIFFINLFGYSTINQLAFAIGATIFVTIGFIWWWWAIYSISQFSSLMVQVASNFQKLQKDLQDLKKNIS